MDLLGLLIAFILGCVLGVACDRLVLLPAAVYRATHARRRYRSGR